MSSLNPDRWYRPSEAAPFLGLHPKTVQTMCSERRIECRRLTGPKGQPRYQILGSTIQGYNRRHTVRPVLAA